MSAPMQYSQGRLFPGSMGRGIWDGTLHPAYLAAVQPEGRSSAGTYGLLDPGLAAEPELPREGLLSASPSGAYFVPIADGSAAPTVGDTGGADAALPDATTENTGSSNIGDHLESFLRALLGMGPVRSDLIEDERGNVHTPEVRQLIHDIGGATKANELALRRRIIEMFRGEPHTANWFHEYLSDIVRGDPPEEIEIELAYRGDQLARERRASVAHLSGLISVPVVAAQPRTRPFTHLNDPVPPDPNVEALRPLLLDFDANREGRAWERAATQPGNLKAMWGTHRNLQGDEFEGVSKGVETAYGRIVGPSLTVERPGQTRIYDYTLLNRLNEVINLVEAKSGMGRIPSKQRAFDRTMSPPVIYRKEADVLSDALKLLSWYDRLFVLRNPPRNPDQRTAWTRR